MVWCFYYCTASAGYLRLYPSSRSLVIQASLSSLGKHVARFENLRGQVVVHGSLTPIAVLLRFFQKLSLLRCPIIAPSSPHRCPIVAPSSPHRRPDGALSSPHCRPNVASSSPDRPPFIGPLLDHYPQSSHRCLIVASSSPHCRPILAPLASVFPTCLLGI